MVRLLAGVKQTTDGVNRSVPRNGLQPSPLSLYGNGALENQVGRWLGPFVLRRWTRRDILDVFRRQQELGVRQALERRVGLMWEGLSDSHMKLTILEHRWKHIVVFRGSRPTRRPMRRPVRRLSIIWRVGCRDLSSRRAGLVAPAAGAFALAFLAGESTSGCEAEANKAIKPLFERVWSMSDGQRGGIVKLFFMPLEFLIRFVLCNIIEIV
jgi:hypothetical protein